MSEKHQKLLRLSDVRERVPYSRSTIYQLIAQGKFPQAISLGERAVAWLESDIDEWIAARVESARTGGRWPLRNTERQIEAAHFSPEVERARGASERRRGKQ